MAAIDERSRYILAGIILFTLVALGIGMAISKTMSHSLTSLAGEVDKVGRLDLTSEVAINSRLLEVHNISEAVVSMRNGLRSFKKYVPADLVVHLNEQRKEAVLEGERRELTVFFSDITDFTAISERLPAEALVENLGVYFDGLSTIIHENMGTLDKYIGDCVMAFWGAPSPRDNHASLACASALACQVFLDDLAQRWAKSGQPVFDTRIGIHTGEVIVGNIGSAQRMNYTIVGDNVNLASRLEGLNKYYGTRILISETCFAQLEGRFAVRKLDIVAVKGKAKGILIYELLGLADGFCAKHMALAERYGVGLDLYLDRQWSQAKHFFEEVSQLSDGKDVASELLAKRCEEYELAPPGSDWNGVYCMREK